MAFSNSESDLLVNLSDVRAADAHQVGSKAAMLGVLRAAGYPVPEGLCLTTTAFAQAEEGCRVPQSLASLLREASVHILPAGSFLAARSSAVAEDLPGASFAGQYQSVIGVADLDGLPAAVETVWRSFASPQAAVLRARLGLADSASGMGVLIQPVIDAEVAGVCFSLDPVTPETNRVVINAVWGLGVGLVEGTLAEDTLHLDRDTVLVTERRVLEKREQYTISAQGGLVRVPVPEAQQRAACLPDAWAKRIAQFALAAERLFGHPQDVEWAITDGQVWILQSRPVASLTGGPWAGAPAFSLTWEQESDARRFWTRSTWERQGKKPLFPLDIDYVRVMESTRLETCLWVGADRNEEIRVINGQVYYSHAPLPISPAFRRVREQAYRDLQNRLAREGHTAWDHWGPEIEQTNLRLRSVDPSALDGPGLADFLETALAARSRHNMLHPMIWFRPLQSYFAAFAALSGKTETPPESAAYRYVEGGDSPLDRLIDGLYGLAEQARAVSEVTAWMREVSDAAPEKLAAPEKQAAPEELAAPEKLASDGKTEDIFARFPSAAPGAEGWRAQFDAYLSEFGDRNGDGYGSESLVSTPTWRDHPEQVIRLAAAFLDTRAEAPHLRRVRARQVLDAEVDALCDRNPDSQIVAAFRQQLDYARRSQAVVEFHNHHIEQVGLGQLRRAVLAAADWLRANDILKEQTDIFWLAFAEILAALRSPKPGSDLVERIAARKADFRSWERLAPPPSLGLPPAALPPRPAYTDAVTPLPEAAPGKIRGVGASAGRVRARARVVCDFQETPVLAPGDILVAQNAGPLWMPFFPILGGVVLEEGALGQHAASTAREYGIPAVIDAHGATDRIPDGAWVTLDGAAGLVEVTVSEE